MDARKPYRVVSVKYVNHGRRWAMQSAEVLETLGVVGGHLPPNGMAPRYIQGVRVWVAPVRVNLGLNWRGRPRKSSQHRVMCECPGCGRVLSLGRLAQHVCKNVAPAVKCPHGVTLEWNECNACIGLTGVDRKSFTRREADVLRKAVAQLMADSPEGQAVRKSFTGQGPRKYFEVHEIALGETQRMATCGSVGEAIVLAKEWHDEWGSRTVALDQEGEVIAEHAAGEPK